MAPTVSVGDTVRSRWPIAVFGQDEKVVVTGVVEKLRTSGDVVAVTIMSDHPGPLPRKTILLEDLALVTDDGDIPLCDQPTTVDPETLDSAAREIYDRFVTSGWSEDEAQRIMARFAM